MEKGNNAMNDQANVTALYARVYKIEDRVRDLENGWDFAATMLKRAGVTLLLFALTFFGYLLGVAV